MPGEIEQIRRVKRQVETGWLNQDAVKAVGIGPTTSGRTGLIVTTVKIDQQVLKLIPEMVEGIPVELRASDTIEAH